MLYGEYSILLSVYGQEQPAFFRKALKSILEQTLLPRQVVLVEDGYLPERLIKVIDEFVAKAEFEITIVKLEKTYDLGQALDKGLKKCSCEIVARADSDDLNLFTRMEGQYKYLQAHQNVAVVGAYIQEFYEANGVTKKLEIRKVPLEAVAIGRFSKRRNPLNHMSVMFRKSVISKCGGYVKMLHFEDYFLWLRVLAKGYQIVNLPKVMVLARTGKNFYTKRTGWKYFREEFSFQRKILAEHFIGPTIFLGNFFTRVIVRLCPPKIMKFVYKALRN